MNNYIKCAVVPSDGLLLGANGEAVFPIRDFEELNWFSKIVNEFGAQVVVQSEFREVAVSELTSGSRQAFGLYKTDDKNYGLYSLYSHLTGRRIINFISKTELIASLAQLEALALPESELNVEILDLISFRNESVIGIFVDIYNSESLRKRLLVSAAALTIRALPSSNITHIDGTAWSTDVVGGVKTYAMGASANDVRKAFQECTSILALTSHSDGIDSPVSVNAILCPVDVNKTNADLRCLKIGVCYRTGKPVSEKNNSLIPVSEINAALVYFNCCYGFPSYRHSHGVSLSILGQFFNNPRVLTVVTHYENAFVTPLTAQYLLKTLLSGDSVFDGLKKLSKIEVFNKYPHRLVVFGEPGIRFEKKVHSPERIATHLSPLKAKNNAVPTVIRFLNEALEMDGSAKHTAVNAIESYYNYAKADNDSGSRKLECFELNLIEHLKVRRHAWSKWISNWSRASVLLDEFVDNCPRCKNKTRRVGVYSIFEQKRVLMRCPVCYCSWDSFDKDTLFFCDDFFNIEFRGDVPDGGLNCLIKIDYVDFGKESINIPWVISNSGNSRMSVNTDLISSGGIFLSIAYIDQGDPYFYCQSIVLD
ncbi:hypothetical protein [Uliginosibacterium sp. TH139]|uniref:hypothetical protein n=1 Tax=Uliginosibacterium sp. TH139 TaxID=2067453 RepID=UPI00117C9B86|nr:hypothetical protein [Uliginosibacterium sp. TH139]